MTPSDAPPDLHPPVPDRPAWLPRYLERLHLDPAVASAPLTGPALAALHLAHLRAVPFENLAIPLGEPVSLVEEDLLDKIVRRRRGGFCYELNGAFALLLRWLGARVTLLAARVHGGDGRLGPPFDHLALAVRTADGTGPWLADVGFGDHSWYPLRLGAAGPQADPGGTFEIEAAAAPDALDVLDVEPGADRGGTPAAGPDLVLRRDGVPQYVLERRPRALADFGPTCWYQCTSPRSHFTRSLICSRVTADGRVSLSGRRLVRTVDGRRAEEALPDDAAVLAAYRDLFGMELPRVPTLAG